jgi:hypothetical protein
MSLSSWCVPRFSPLVAGSLALAAACGSQPPPLPSGGAACQLPPLQVHIAVDRSGSLNSVWNEDERAVRNLAAAIDAIPDGAIVHLDVFTVGVRQHGPWKLDRPRLVLRDSVVRAMDEAPAGNDTDIYAVADVLARRIASDSSSKHIVFFISDEKHSPPAASSVDSASVGRAWRALRERFGPDRLRVISIRVGTDPDSVFSRLAGVASADTAGIPAVGAKVGEHIANDPLVAQLRRERESALVEATLEPAAQRLGYGGGEVAIRLRSWARCGVYRLDDGTQIGPGREVVVHRHVESGVSFVDGLLLRRAPGGEAAALIPAAAYPRVVGYRSQGEGTRDTVYSAGGVPQRPHGRITFGRLWWPHVLLLASLALLTWLLLPPRGGSLSMTAALAPGTEVDLGPARRGKEVLTPDEPVGPWIAVRLVRRSRLLPPSRVRLVARVLSKEPVTIAWEQPGDESLAVSHYEAGEEILLDRSAFLLWPNKKGEARSRKLDPYNADAFRGYHWKPRS